MTERFTNIKKLASLTSGSGRVTAEFDDGAVVHRREVDVFADDTAETLQARVLPVEHEAMIDFLLDVSDDRVTVQRRSEPLVKPWEEMDLWYALDHARKQYPHG
ncbi:hypothetical protein HY469_03755 [Candidatus Roizmanbacteria bacterium]|nr:hypothetical protein [Candidatus Roizmanbacteria bacterium]